ncbi:MAG: PP2C family protein-serine/threonine phosphatase, partial [Mycobacterium sp.]
ASGSPPATAAPSYAGYSHIGQRSSNDDRWAADPTQGLYVVADGVGSAGGGGLAAQLVTELLPTYLPRRLSGADLSGPDAAALLGNAVAQLSDDLHARGETEPGLAEAHTTVVAAVVTAFRAVIAHLGDSRAYLYRDHRVHRLTSDHSLVESLIGAGEITPAEAADHPMRTMVTRHVGMTPPASPDVCGVDLQPGDRMLLCTDGLHDVVDDSSLAAVLATHPDPTQACAALIEAANQAGSPSNTTALVVDIPTAAPEFQRLQRAV